MSKFAHVAIARATLPLAAATSVPETGWNGP
jgi:hypothetical protein